MLLGKEVGLGSGGIVLDGDPAPPKRALNSPHFALAWSHISATAELLY